MNKQELLEHIKNLPDFAQVFAIGGYQFEQEVRPVDLEVSTRVETQCPHANCPHEHHSATLEIKLNGDW